MIIENFRMYFDNYGALECKAPCSMYSVLLQHGLTPDPFYGINELEATKLSEKDCAFEGEFEITDEMLKKEHLEITFLGLDTICKILFNGKEIASVKNLDEQAAKLELLKQGFLYNNIEVMEKYDEDATPGVVLDQEPKAKSKVSTDIKVKIYINSYEGEEETDSDNSDSNGWF